MRHTVFGPGSVTGVDLKKGAHIVQFDDMPTSRAISFKGKLEKMES